MRQRRNKLLFSVSRFCSSQAISNYDELMAAKKKEISALQASIEAKMTKIGELGVSIAQMKNDLTDTQDTL